MATTVRSLGKYVWINNVRFVKNSLQCDKEGDLWTIRGDSPQVLVSDLDYGSCINTDDGKAFDSNQDFEDWLNENVAPVHGSNTSANNYGLPELVNNGQPVYLLGNSARVHVIDCTEGQTEVYLPDEENSPATGLVFTIKKIDSSANTVIIHAQEGGLIDGQETIEIGSENDYRTIIFDGKNWWIIGTN